jgi:hypothetical protein
MYAPRNTPKPIMDALVDALQKALKDPPLINRFAELSMTPVEAERATPAALERLLKAEVDRWGQIIRMPALPHSRAARSATAGIGGTLGPGSNEKSDFHARSDSEDGQVILHRKWQATQCPSALCLSGGVWLLHNGNCAIGHLVWK